MRIAFLSSQDQEQKLFTTRIRLEAREWDIKSWESGTILDARTAVKRLGAGYDAIVFSPDPRNHFLSAWLRNSPLLPASRILAFCESTHHDTQRIRPLTDLGKYRDIIAKAVNPSAALLPKEVGAIDVFLSYCSSDAEVGRKLAYHLAEKGIACLMAPDGIPGGTDWTGYLREGLTRAALFLIILSQASRESRWVTIESGAAWVLEKPVVPISIEEGTSASPDPFGNIQCTHHLHTGDYLKLANHIQKCLRRLRKARSNANTHAADEPLR